MLPLRLLPPAFVMLLLADAAACSRPRPVQPQATPADSPPAAADPARGDSDGRADSGREALDERATGAGGSTRDRERAIVQARIYFDFDRSDLTADARGALAAKLSVLLANPDMHIEIAGHADERGSDEYNLALGLARAAAAKRYLTQRGVASDRISVISIGEERPVCTESSESCWWQNRRDEFAIAGIARARRP